MTIMKACIQADKQAKVMTMRVVDKPDTGRKNDHYAGNREPLTPSPFIKLPVGAVEPQGWKRKQLELEAEGFVGRLTEISQYLRKPDNPWLDPDANGTNHWEEAAETCTVADMMHSDEILFRMTGDTVTLELPMEISLTIWKKNRNSVSVNRGPLTYSLKISAKHVRRGGTDSWPTWEVYPITDKNYLVSLKWRPSGTRQGEASLPSRYAVHRDGSPYHLIPRTSVNRYKSI